MERNSENRNRNGNERNRRQNDQYNDQNLSSDYQQNRRQDWERGGNQWNSSSKNRGNRQGHYGPYSDSVNDRRLESMGSLGNDWTNRNDTDDYNSDRGFRNDRTNTNERDYYNRERNFGGRDSGYYEDRNSSNDYRNFGNSGYDDRDRNRQGSYGRSDNSRSWWDKTKDEVSGWFGDENAQYRRERDQQEEHRGKGPKGYVRTDERIKEDVHERLTDDGWVDASEIEVDVKNGEVFLKGTVNNRQEKRRAEDIVENISGVKNVENHIKVQQAGSKSASTGQYGEKRFGNESGSALRTPATGEYNKSN